MPRQRSSNAGRSIPFPFNTEHYIPIETLNRGPNGRVYDPNRPLPLRENPPAPAPRRYGENPIPFNRKVLDNWYDNVARVLGREYRMQWGDMTTMNNYLERHVRQQPGGRVVFEGEWPEEDIEKAGRLMAWGAPFLTLEALLGWPTVPISDEIRDRIAHFAGEERRLLG